MSDLNRNVSVCLYEIRYIIFKFLFFAVVANWYSLQQKYNFIIIKKAIEFEEVNVLGSERGIL